VEPFKLEVEKCGEQGKETRCKTTDTALVLRGLKGGASFASRARHRQEKALVTGYEAAKAVTGQLGLDSSGMAAALDVEADEPHVAAGRAGLKALRGLLQPPAFG
jgi:hypothetical protein